jgi:hypothetical protein
VHKASVRMGKCIVPYRKSAGKLTPGKCMTRTTKRRKQPPVLIHHCACANFTGEGTVGETHLRTCNASTNHIRPQEGRVYSEHGWEMVLLSDEG